MKPINAIRGSLLAIGLIGFAFNALAATVGPFTSSPGAAIPDGSDGCAETNPGTAVVDTITVGQPGTVQDVQTFLDIPHTWVGDLRVVLQSPSGTSVVLYDSNTDSSCGCSSDNINATLSDSAATNVNAACPPTAGPYQPGEPLSAFAGESLAGDWTLSVQDAQSADTGTLNSWSLTFDAQTGGTSIPTLSWLGLLLLAGLLTSVVVWRMRG